MPPSKIVPLLADSGQYLASESTFYKVLREKGQLSHRHKSKPRTGGKPRSLLATGPNQVYSWDITYLPTTVTGMFFYLYMVMDIYSRKIVGWQVHQRESSELAADLMTDICLREGVGTRSSHSALRQRRGHERGYVACDFTEAWSSPVCEPSGGEQRQRVFGIIVSDFEIRAVLSTRAL